MLPTNCLCGLNSIVTLADLIVMLKLTIDLKNLLSNTLVITLPCLKDIISLKEIEFLVTPHAWPKQIFQFGIH